MNRQAQSPLPQRRSRRWLTCMAVVLLLLAIAAAALFVFLSASRTVSDSGVRTRLTRDWETVAAAASQVGRAPAATPTMPPARRAYLPCSSVPRSGYAVAESGGPSCHTIP